MPQPNRARPAGLPPFTGEADYRLALFELASACLSHMVLLKQESQRQNSAVNLPGSFMTAEEAMRYLAGYPASIYLPGEERAAGLLAMEGEIAGRLAATPGAGAFRLEQLRAVFSMAPVCFFALVCALACEVDRGFEQLFTMAHNEKDRPWPTLGAVLALYGMAHPAPEEADLALLCPDDPDHHLLFQPAPPGCTRATRPLALRRQLVGWLLGQSALGETLARCGQVIFPGDAPPDTAFIRPQLQALRRVAAGPGQPGKGSLTLLCGPAGSGKKTALQALAGEFGLWFLLLPFEQLFAGADPEALLPDLVLPMLLEGCLPCFEFPAAAARERCGDALLRLLGLLRRHQPSVFLLFEHLKSGLTCPGYVVTRADFTYLTQPQALELWRRETAAEGGPFALDLPVVSAKYLLTAGQAGAALQTARALAGEAPVDDSTLSRAILLNNSSRLSELADPVALFYTWEDLVLDDAPTQQLRNVCNRIKYKYQIENDWDFKSKSAYGKGISVLLYGPPGTGKTMSAQVIAGELAFPLFRIDLSRIISKYIGETAKNLDAIFTEAKASNVILFFDEADALFSKRTDVKSSNDRHANSEVSYLLQKIEDYAGVCILSTNLASHFDEAFRRRIDYMINIHMPSAHQRRTLWRGAFPGKAPLEEGVDFKLLADNLEFSGSVIKSAALQAAFFAMEQGAPIGMAHIARAVRLELTKLGKSEPHFLQSYRTAGE